MSNVTELKVVPGSNMKILDKAWFQGGTGCVGFVLCEDLTTGQTMAFMGATGASGGQSEEADALTIAQWGSKMPKAIAEAQFGPLPDYKY